MYIMGILCFYHDSAACIVKDGNILAAVQEERFTRKKHDPRFLKNAIKYCLDEAAITIQRVDYVVFYDKPFLTFERLFLSYMTVALKGLRSWLEAAHFLGRVVTSLALAIAHYLVITPSAMVKRIVGGTPLLVKPDKGSSSYWVTRSEPAQTKQRFLKRF